MTRSTGTEHEPQVPGPERPPSTFSRRRFVSSSLVAVSGLSLVGGASRAMSNPPTPLAASVTTLTDVLEAAPVPAPGGPVPGRLLEFARERAVTPEELAQQLDTELGADAVAYLGLLDRFWQHETPFGEQPLDRRQAVLEWATRRRETLPDLGPLRAGAPPGSGTSSNADPRSPDEPWRVCAVLLLGFAAGLADLVTLPVEEPQEEGSAAPIEEDAP